MLDVCQTYAFTRNVKTGVRSFRLPMRNLVQLFPEFSLWEITILPQGPKYQDSCEFAFDANSRDITSKTVLDLSRMALVLGGEHYT